MISSHILGYDFEKKKEYRNKLEILFDLSPDISLAPIFSDYDFIIKNKTIYKNCVRINSDIYSFVDRELGREYNTNPVTEEDILKIDKKIKDVKTEITEIKKYLDSIGFNHL